jgi:hypothetical protein
MSRSLYENDGGRTKHIFPTSIVTPTLTVTQTFTCSGAISFGNISCGNITATGNISCNEVSTVGDIDVGGDLNAVGNVTTENLNITGAINGGSGPEDLTISTAANRDILFVPGAGGTTQVHSDLQVVNGGSIELGGIEISYGAGYLTVGGANKIELWENGNIEGIGIGCETLSVGTSAHVGGRPLVPYYKCDFTAANPPVVLRETVVGGFSIARNGDGDYTVTYSALGLQSIPTIIATPVGGNALWAVVEEIADEPTTTAVTISCLDETVTKVNPDYVSLVLFM